MELSKEKKFKFRLRLERERAQQASQPKGQGDYWGDVGKNAMAGLKQAPQMLQGLGQTAVDVLGVTDPIEAAKSAYQMYKGKPFGQTPTGQHAEGVKNLVTGIPGAIFEGAKDLGRVAAAPLEMMGGTPVGQTSMGRNFRERPISMPFNAASTAIPVLKGAKMATGAVRGALAGSEANFLERAGARGINKAIGIGPTIEELTPRGQNPGKVGVEIGREIAEEGFAGKTATEAFDQAKSLTKQYGAAVDDAYNQIKAQNRRFGEWDDMTSPLKMEGNKSVKPFLEKAFKLEKSPYPDDSVAGKWYRAAYDSLSEKANTNKGFLTLDHIRDELSHVGDLIGRTGEANKGIVRKLYGELANMRDAIVEEVASASGRPELGEALRTANKGYSKYIRMLPDISSQSAKSAATKTGSFLKHPWDKTIDTLEPTIASGMYKAGKLARGVSTAADEVMSIPGRAMDSLRRRSLITQFIENRSKGSR